MGYQAILFCPDEKLARIVSQVFTDLDFSVEPVHEPFAAVKKLMSQRYDAIVVDCENEQNASLLFKSARNSSSNQSSLAIAVVEGQAGVAKAYRIGANLVLTKPINVEQAKGTLRVARGLLRKNSDAATGAIGASTPAASSSAAHSSGSTAFQAASTMTPQRSHPDLPESAATPTAAAAALGEDKSAVAAISLAQSETAVTLNREEVMPQVTSTGSGKNDAVGSAIATVSAGDSNSSVTSASGSAAATAPAKETAAQKRKKAKASESESTDHTYSSDPIPTLGSKTTPISASPLAIDDEDSSGSGGSRKIMIAAVVILAAAAIGYLGYGKFGNSSSTPAPQSVTAPPAAAQPAAAVAPAPSAEPEFSTPATDVPVFPTPGLASKVNTATSEPASRKTDSAPILVKSNTSNTKMHLQADDSAPPLPSAQSIASANDSNLSSLLSSTSPSLAKPSLATLRISQGVSQGLLIKRVQPKYPHAALSAHTQGAVQIEATINKEGYVANPKVISGDPILAHAALDAVRQWRYKPYYLDGQPVEIQTQITVNFKTN